MRRSLLSIVEAAGKPIAVCLQKTLGQVLPGLCLPLYSIAAAAGKPIAVCLQETQDCTRPSTARVMVREIWGNNWLRILIPTRRILWQAENSSSEENASGNRTANAHKESVDSRIGSLASRSNSPSREKAVTGNIQFNLEIEQLLYLVQEPIISEPPKDEAVDETEDQKATGKRKLPASEELYQWKPVFPKIEEKGKRPMSELYE
ncbi:hypothetical protein HAX54_039480 [Datura stramonium]|uniref:Uncharacterized protein n=1 Tax=Datura stramonium TaxID=4076 RepID=A0ABS8SIZ9_DATST|nr:hypothetical protein [Datura stramonium]